uniref:Uncharacterized protein n=1 Tax=Theileria parva TaxID=5875 RepID=Q4N1I5_THEPA|eukprot:XP_764390.1 hypothetical protein [Theileria parva strain Muguga]
MESGLIIGKSKESRKVLDPNPNKIVENKINKLISINSQHFTAFNGKLEEILTLDYGKLLPNELLKIFEILSKNLYYNEKIYSLVFKAVLDKVVYFNTDELISLLTHINRISAFYSSNDSINSTSDGTELVLNSPTHSKLDVQKVIKRVLEVLENKLKYKKDDYLGLNILSIINKLSHFNCWNLSTYLSTSVLNNILLNTDNTINVAECVNIILDNCSLRIIDIICSNPQLGCGDNNSNLELFNNKNLLLSYYSAGDFSILPLLTNIVNNDHVSDISSSVSPLDFGTLSSTINRVHNILLKSEEQLYNIESNCLNSLVEVCFKLFYCTKFINLSQQEVIYVNIFNRVEKYCYNQFHY